MAIKTTDVCDRYGDQVQVVDSVFSNYGGTRTFEGKISTLKVHEDNVLVHEAFQEPGEGRVLVIDGGGSLRTAVVGDHLAACAAQSGWAGIVIYGCVRDARDVEQISIGLKAIHTCPRRPGKNRIGWRDVPVTFAGVAFKPGQYLYADEDGIVIAESALDMS